MQDQEAAVASPTLIDPETLDPREQAAYEIMVEICEASSLAMHPEVRGSQPPYLEVELVGEDIADTFGRQGPAIDALQYLANLVIVRRVGPEVRVVLDVGGYRERRAAMLISLAQEFAAQVKEMQQECELDPLPAHERRIIHNALSGDPLIRTYSEGDDPDRRVIIAPS